jgi:hypothetical protein
MIGRDIEPHCLTIGNEELLLRCLIFPTHATGAAKVNLSGFGLQTLAAIAVPLKKDRLECFGVMVACLKGASDGGGTRTDIGLGGINGGDNRQRSEQ